MICLSFSFISCDSSIVKFYEFLYVTSLSAALVIFYFHFFSGVVFIFFSYLRFCRNVFAE